MTISNSLVCFCRLRLRDQGEHSWRLPSKLIESDKLLSKWSQDHGRASANQSRDALLLRDLLGDEEVDSKRESEVGRGEDWSIFVVEREVDHKPRLRYFRIDEIRPNH